MITKKDLIDRINKGFQTTYEFHRPLFAQWNRNFKMYKGKTPERKYKSEANFHVPYAATLADSVWPILTSRLPFAKVEGRNPERDYPAADLMGELLDYTYDINNFEYKFLMWQKNTFYFDTAWLKVGWDYQDAKTDHPKLEIIDSNYVLPHRRKLELDDRWPIYHFREMTKSEMLEAGYNKDAIKTLSDSKLGSSEYRRKTLQAMGVSTEGGESTHKSDDLYMVVEAWLKMNLEEDELGEERMCRVVIANEETDITPKPIKNKKKYESPYKHDYFPFVPLYFNKDAAFFHGESLIGEIYSQGQELNALENMKADNYKRRNNPPLKIRRSGNVDLGTLKYVNSAPWLVNEQDDIVEHNLADLAPSIDNQQRMIRTTMQNRVGANDVLLVTDDISLKGGDTYGGAAIANENTKLRFRPQAILIDTAITRVGELCIALYQDPNLFDRAKAIAIADKEGNIKLENIKPSDVTGDLVYKVQSSSTLAESATNKLAKLLNIKELYADNMELKHEVLDKEIFKAADLDYESIFKTIDEQKMDLVFKLRELIATAQKPGFEQQPEQVKQGVLAQIDKIKTMLGGEQAPMPAEQPGVAPEGQPSPAEQMESQ